MSDLSDGATDPGPSDKWWVPIAGLPGLVPVFAVGSLAFPPDPYSQAALLPFVVLGGLLVLGSPLFVYRDRAYLAEVTDWRPSGWYYLMILPPLGLVLAVAYLYQRHEHVGVP